MRFRPRAVRSVPNASVFMSGSVIRITLSSPSKPHLSREPGIEGIEGQEEEGTGVDGGSGMLDVKAEPELEGGDGIDGGIMEEEKEDSEGAGEMAEGLPTEVGEGRGADRVEGGEAEDVVEEARIAGSFRKKLEDADEGRPEGWVIAEGFVARPSPEEDGMQETTAAVREEATVVGFMEG